MLINWISIEKGIPPFGEIVLFCDSINEFVSLGHAFKNDHGQIEFYLNTLLDMQPDTVPDYWAKIPLPKPFKL